jgi:hypothetical protein
VIETVSELPDARGMPRKVTLVAVVCWTVVRVLG